MEYLGSIFQTDGDHKPDIKRRVTMVISLVRAGKVRHKWEEENLSLKLKLKLRLYKSTCYSILTYGSEVWVLDDRV